jgi:cytoplasmic iron level regulating protein YaaA (DUF328/UPF0246 family)
MDSHGKTIKQFWKRHITNIYNKEKKVHNETNNLQKKKKKKKKVQRNTF